MNIAFLYAGQGSQVVGMGKDFYESNETFRKNFDLLPDSLKTLAFEGEMTELSKTSNTQPIMVAYAIALTEVLKEQGIKPKMVAGLSLGEYSALYTSEVFTAKDAIEIVRFRGEQMEKAAEGLNTKMAAVLNLSRELLEEAVKEASQISTVEIANYNCPGQIVIAGTLEAVDRACELAMEKGAKRCVALKVSGPFHTSFMKPCGDALRDEFKKYSFSDMKIPVVFNAIGKEKSEENSIPELLEKQVQSSVYFEDSIRYMIQNGIDTFVEIGPGKVLSGFIKKIDKTVNVIAIDSVETLDKALEMLH